MTVASLASDDEDAHKCPGDIVYRLVTLDCPEIKRVEER